jgi:large repetitive protein
MKKISLRINPYRTIFCSVLAATALAVGCSDDASKEPAGASSSSSSSSSGISSSSSSSGSPSGGNSSSSSSSSSGGSSGMPTPASYTIGGTVSGLKGIGLSLQNNAGDDLVVAADGKFTFKTAVLSGKPYDVKVKTQPGTPTQTCTVTMGAGNIGMANVDSVQVACATNQYAIGGAVSGLSSGELILQNNTGDDLRIIADGTFAFAKKVDSGASYKVTIKAAPVGLDCSLMGDSGTVVAGDVSSVGISCAPKKYMIGGTVSGLKGTGLILQNNAGDDLPLNMNGTFAFATTLLDKADYAVTVKAQPGTPSQSCTVSGGVGKVALGNVTAVQVVCETSKFQVGGSVSGLKGSGLMLQNNAGDDLRIAADGPSRLLRQWKVALTMR